MKKILVADSLDKEAMEQLKAVPGFEVTVKTGMDEAALVKTIPGFNAVVVRSATKITKHVISGATNLEIDRPRRHRPGQCRRGGGQGQGHQGGQHAGRDDHLGGRTRLRPHARRGPAARPGQRHDEAAQMGEEGPLTGPSSTEKRWASSAAAGSG